MKQGPKALAGVLRSSIKNSIDDFKDLAIPSNKANKLTGGGRKKGFVFRGDDRSPDEIFESGFTSKGDNTDDLLDHAANNPSDSGFISTSKDPNVSRVDFGEEGDFVFTIKKQKNGRDVNKELGFESPVPHELEIAVPLRIFPSDIFGARKIGPNNKFKGPFIKNPKFR